MFAWATTPMIFSANLRPKMISSDSTSLDWDPFSNFNNYNNNNNNNNNNNTHTELDSIGVLPDV